jgi:beta-glucanase (GH16 family)
MRANRFLIFTALVALGCSNGGSTANNDATGSGGGDATGGGTSTGGSSSAGRGGAGGAATGGAAGTSAGGSSNTGSGGAAGGGGHATGGGSGAGGKATGGASGAGGKATGGASGAGGKAAGGASGAGGKATGGASGAGGKATGGATGSGGAADGGTALAGWVLTWFDEFNGPDGSAADSTKWVNETGGDGWGNNELEYYTAGTANAVVQGGNLVITATNTGTSGLTCSYPSNGPCGYTSARLKTQGKFTQQYGRFEARIQIPEGQGLWPAFWMLGADIDTQSWPKCGEIDIMENIGSEPSVNHGSLHMPAAGTSNDSQLTGMYTLPGGAKLGDGFHTYAVEWSAASIKFYVDDNLYETQTPATATNRTWEFNQPFFIILNVAVGGNFPGAPSSSTTFPQTMKVDWVRVYSPSDGG